MIKLEVQTGLITASAIYLSALNQDLSVNDAPNFLYPGAGKVTTDIGMGSNSEIHGAVLQADGKIVMTAYTSTAGDYDIAVVRYHPDYSLDTTFDGDGVVTTAFGTTRDYGIDVAMQADGKLLVAGVSGEWPSYKYALARYNTDGSLDTSFSEDGKVAIDLGASVDYGNSIAVQADGKILVGGASWAGGQSNFGLLRFNPDGSLDTSFDGDGKVSTDFDLSSDSGTSTVVQVDGKIIVAGDTDANGNLDFALARYQADGSLDASFGVGGKVITAIGTGNDSARGMTLQSDGKILVSGYSNSGSNTDFAVIRYNTDGSLDLGFGNDGKVVIDTGSTSDDGFSVAVGADGRIWLAGASNVANSAFC